MVTIIALLVARGDTPPFFQKGPSDPGKPVLGHLGSLNIMIFHNLSPAKPSRRQHTPPGGRHFHTTPVDVPEVQQRCRNKSIVVQEIKMGDAHADADADTDESATSELI